MLEDLDKHRRAKAQREIEELIAGAEAETRARMFTFLAEVGAILKQRGDQYGPVLTHWSRTAGLWSLLLEHKLVEPLDARDVARLYVADKLSRDTHAINPDTARDIAGYAAGMASLEPEVEP